MYYHESLLNSLDALETPNAVQPVDNFDVPTFDANLTLYCFNNVDDELPELSADHLQEELNAPDADHQNGEVPDAFRSLIDQALAEQYQTDHQLLDAPVVPAPVPVQPRVSVHSNPIFDRLLKAPLPAPPQFLPQQTVNDLNKHSIGHVHEEPVAPDAVYKNGEVPDDIVNLLNEWLAEQFKKDSFGGGQVLELPVASRVPVLPGTPAHPNPTFHRLLKAPVSAPSTVDPSPSPGMPCTHLYQLLDAPVVPLPVPMLPELSLNDLYECLPTSPDLSGGKNEDSPGTSSFDAPSTSSFDAPGTSSFEAPGTSSFDAPGTSSFDAPSTSSFDPPGTSRFNLLGTSSSGAPSTISFNSPLLMTHDSIPSTSTGELVNDLINHTVRQLGAPQPSTSTNQLVNDLINHTVGELEAPQPSTSANQLVNDLINHTVGQLGAPQPSTSANKLVNDLINHTVGQLGAPQPSTSADQLVNDLINHTVGQLEAPQLSTSADQCIPTTSDMKVTCDHCRKSYATMTALKRHMKTHYTVKTYNCKFCKPDPIPTSKEELSAHMMTHKGAFACEICKDSFISKACLNAHQSQHDVIGSPYACMHCEQRFKQSSNLKRHVRSAHEDVKDFQCTVCKKDFTQLGNLKTHIKTFHGTTNK